VTNAEREKNYHNNNIIIMVEMAAILHSVAISDEGDAYGL